MAESKGNIVMQGISGTIARMLTFRQRAGKTIVAKLRRATPASDSEKATAVRTKFKSSIEYASKAILDAATKANYLAAALPGQSAFNVAVADAFNAPEISKIDSSAYHGAVGDSITVQATDDFKVTGVTVSIHNAAGNLVEQGAAVVQPNTIDWLYKATVANAATAGSKVTAVATDLPGNNTSLDATL
jgi:hypothetical protein